MTLENLKIIGAVEMTLALTSISLGLILLQVSTFFQKEIFLVFIAGVWSTLSGFKLVCGGRKPSYSCVRYTVTFHLPCVMFSAVAFGYFVRHVPYKYDRYCGYSVSARYNCSSVSTSNETMVLVGGILAVLLTIFMVQTLLSLATILIGGCFMLDISPEGEDSNRIVSTASAPLCPAPEQQLMYVGEPEKVEG